MLQLQQLLLLLLLLLPASELSATEQLLPYLTNIPPLPCLPCLTHDLPGCAVRLSRRLACWCSPARLQQAGEQRAVRLVAAAMMMMMMMRTKRRVTRGFGGQSHRLPWTPC